MEKKKQENRTIENQNMKNKSSNLGLDPDEQEMNGLYGMVETEYEDNLPHSNK